VPARKTSAVNLRMDLQVKELLRLAAQREHRTLSNMLERLVLQHCEREGIDVGASDTNPPPLLPQSKRRPARRATRIA